MIPRKTHLRAFLALAAAAICGGCASQPAGPSIPRIAEEINATRSDDLLVALSPGDTLGVRFDQRAEWDHDVRIRADGQASFQSVGEVQAAGLSIPQLREKLTVLYARIFQDPVVTVNVTTPAVRAVVVTGEVNSPGPIELGTGRLTLIEALARAGGHKTDSARLDNTLLVRWLPQEGRQVAWRIDADTDHWGAPEAILLQPHDVVYVPNTPVVKVNIWVDRYIRQMIPIPTLIPRIQ
ncbi:MAG: polysaccharide biosynthesis/export family protein [Planctomycetota bacterium]|jgi:protein involved in polysaccharide export with SLBB domain|nr:polysaccharide biosynthesis/export family protein [Planctomycetota bacterium]MDP6761669.1 polysaccharide biosynthesis/export family protein [Planctomycetota bacterium]MDP6990625.1 polysaccharide biosynthesis/export family protein [Planctomycetota bacterium]